MAKQMSYTDQAGVTAATSYWRIIRIEIDLAAKSVIYTFVGFRDSVARTAGLAPLSGAVRYYVITGTAYNQLLAQATAPNAPNLVQLGYDYAQATKDVPTATPGQFVGFFDSAVDVA